MWLMSKLLLIVCETIFKEVEKTSIHNNFKRSMIRCIITDGSKNMYTNIRGLWRCVENLCLFIILLNQQIPWRIYLNLSCAIKPVISVVDFLHSHRLHHCPFYELLSDIKDDYPDLSYHRAVQ